MGDNPVVVPRYIALRYVSVGKRSHLVSFMSAISIFGLVLGVAILITVLSVMNGFDREMRENILGIVPHITLDSEENLDSEAWDGISRIAGRHSMVESVAPVIQMMAVVATPGDRPDNGEKTRINGKGVLVNGIDAELEPGVSAIDRFMREGGLARLQQTRWGIILGQTLAQRLGVNPGDSVDLFSPDISLNPITPVAPFRRFEVAGIFRVGAQELDGEFAMVNLAAARALFKLRAPYNGLRLRTTDVLTADQTRMELLAALPAEVTVTSWTARFGNIYENIRFSRTIVGFMLWLLVGVAAFNLIVSLTMIVRDKRGDIAILRTLGASPQLISRIFIWQGCLIGLIGIGIGVVLGIIGALRVSELVAWIEERFAVQFLSAEVYPIDFLPSELQVADILAVVIGVMLLTLLATVYPARRAAAIQPAEALRAD